MDTTKTMTITGGAAESYMNKGSKTRRRRSTAQEGGTSPGTMNQLASTRVPPTVNAPPATPSQPSNLAKVTNSASAPLAGGSSSKPVKVILGPKAAKSQVILSPKKSSVLATATTTTNAKTRKHAKKIRMSLGGFGKRVTRANKIRFDAKKQGIEEIKKILKDAKLVKDTTKAPDAVLRSMYSDFMMLKSRAL